MQHVVLMGNPVDGFVVIGPFEELEDARSYIATDPCKENMWITELQTPDANDDQDRESYSDTQDRESYSVS